MRNIAIFASGNGTNAENIISYFRDRSRKVNVSFILTNKSDAKVIERGKKLNIESYFFNNETIKNSPSEIISVLKSHQIDLIVLAGYMTFIPDEITSLYENRIINIHPSLLPKYGGKGMHGVNVHKAVIAAGEKESGITIHYVNQEYDKGRIIFQAKCSIAPEESATTLEEKIHQLEYKYYPDVISQILDNLTE